jgi:hypothetical protein
VLFGTLSKESIPGHAARQQAWTDALCGAQFMVKRGQVPSLFPLAVVEHNSGEPGIEANFAARFEVERRALYPFAAMCRAIIFQTVTTIRKLTLTPASRINHQPAKDYFQLLMKETGRLSRLLFSFQRLYSAAESFPTL